MHVQTPAARDYGQIESNLSPQNVAMSDNKLFHHRFLYTRKICIPGYKTDQEMTSNAPQIFNRSNSSSKSLDVLTPDPNLQSPPPAKPARSHQLDHLHPHPSCTSWRPCPLKTLALGSLVDLSDLTARCHWRHWELIAQPSCSTTAGTLADLVRRSNLGAGQGSEARQTNRYDPRCPQVVSKPPALFRCFS